MTFGKKYRIRLLPHIISKKQDPPYYHSNIMLSNAIMHHAPDRFQLAYKLLNSMLWIVEHFSMSM